MTLEQLIPDVVDLKKPIYGKTLNVEWLLDSLRSNDKIYQKLHGDRAVKDLENDIKSLKRVTFYDVSGGKGFLSVVLRCTVHFVDSTSANDVYHTILKVPGLESIEEASKKSDHDMEEHSKNRDQHAFLMESHQFECDFYNTLAPILNGPCPKVYKTEELIFGKKEGVLHMEDLTLRGKTISHFENINLSQVKSVIKAIAHMHKNILTADKALWRGKFLKNQTAFVDLVSALDSMIEPLVKKSKREDAFVPLIEKLRKFYSNKDYTIFAAQQSFADLGMAPVLVHGDMHSGNIMWAIDEDGNIQNELAAFVDWQIMHEGSPMSDLSRFLTHCCDGVVRRQAETFAVEFYHECLTKEFGGKNVPYTVEQLKKAYNYAFLIQSFFAVAVTQIFFTSFEEKLPNQAVRNAFHSAGVLKALHLLEDADRLLEGEMKAVFEKYNV
uniref:CHK kinase-like domain-containing protein n=1 Tax=Panagrolaimus davidi TaxID=227884 RepID=A0A914PVX2_9BILA